MTLGVSPDGVVRLALSNRNGDDRIVMSLGADDVPAVGLTDKAGKVRAAFTISGDGAPSVALFDEHAKPRAFFGYAPLAWQPTGAREKELAPSLAFFDKDESLIWAAP